MSSIIRIRNGVIEVILLREAGTSPALECYLDRSATPVNAAGYGEAVQSNGALCDFCLIPCATLRPARLSTDGQSVDAQVRQLKARRSAAPSPCGYSL